MISFRFSSGFSITIFLMSLKDSIAESFIEIIKSPLFIPAFDAADSLTTFPT